MTHIGMQILQRNFSSTSTRNFKVCLVGASGGIGQPLSLLLKMNTLIKHLNLHDLQHAKGVAADCSHINTRTKVKYFQGVPGLKDAFKGCHLVVCVAGVPRKPGMTRDDLFVRNAVVVKEVAKAAAAVNPDVFIHVVTNPVNAVVPVACATYKKLKKGNPKHVFGITTLDLIRASTFVGRLRKLDPKKVKVPIVGGHAGETIVPLFSKCKPNVKMTKVEVDKLTPKVQNAGTEVVKAKAGQGSATLSMAFAAYRTSIKFLKALKGESNIYECCYVPSNVTKLKYFSSPLLLGKNGIQKNLGIPKGITSDEKKRIAKAITILAGSIKKGETYAKKG